VHTAIGLRVTDQALARHPHAAFHRLLKDSRRPAIARHRLDLACEQARQRSKERSQEQIIHAGIMSVLYAGSPGNP
jgi:hypothetical protein